MKCTYYTLVCIVYIYFYYKKITLYNEERRLGVQRGSDTLVVPLITSNDGLSIALLITVHLPLNLLNLINSGLSS